MSKKNVPYAKLKKWEKIVDIQLILLSITATMAIIMYFVGSASMDIFWDIVVGIITGLITSMGASIFIYFKFLKHIPEETKKQIDNLLNARLGYETTNHNATMVALNPDNSHLSKEHTEIKDIIGREYSNIKAEVKSATNVSFAIKDHLVQSDYEKKLQYSNLKIKQKDIVDSIEKIYDVGKALQSVNNENAELRGNLNHIKTECKQLIEKHNILIEKHNKLVNEYNQIAKEQNYHQRREQQYYSEVDFDR